jgi:hypothetical protein
VATSWATPSERSIGVLTGTRIAGVIGRIPIRDAARALRTDLEALGFETPRAVLTLADWVDNIIKVAPTADRAIRMQTLFEGYLYQVWNLRIKDGSRSFVTARADECIDAPPWEAKKVMKTLGHSEAVGDRSEPSHACILWEIPTIFASALHLPRNCSACGQISLAQNCLQGAGMATPTNDRQTDGPTPAAPRRDVTAHALCSHRDVR